MLNFPVDLEFASITYFFAKLAEVTHDALELLGLSLEIIDKRTKIELLVLIQPIADHPEPVFQRFKISFHALILAFNKGFLKLAGN